MVSSAIPRRGRRNAAVAAVTAVMAGFLLSLIHI